MMRWMVLAAVWAGFVGLACVVAPEPVDSGPCVPVGSDYRAGAWWSPAGVLVVEVPAEDEPIVWCAP